MRIALDEWLPDGEREQVRIFFGLGRVIRLRHCPDAVTYKYEVQFDESGEWLRLEARDETGARAEARRSMERREANA